MTTMIAAQLPVNIERREARPVPATACAAGVSLVPQIRPLGKGGLADILAMRRHDRHQQRRRATAA